LVKLLKSDEKCGNKSPKTPRVTTRAPHLH
jgi:hypothetical protein